MPRIRPSQPRLEPFVTDAEAPEASMPNSYVPPPNFYAAMGHSERAMRGLGSLGWALMGTDANVPVRERELVILRVAWNCAAQYEFGDHTLRAREAGMTDDEILTLAGGDPEGWSDDDRALVAFVDEVCDDNCITDETWAKLARRWTPEQLVELILLSGAYRTVAGFQNSAGTQPEEGVPGWPPGVAP